MDHQVSDTSREGRRMGVIAAWVLWVGGTVMWMLYGTVKVGAGWSLGEPMRIPSILFSYARSVARIGWGEGMLTTLLIFGVLALVGTFALGWMLLPRSSTSTDVATPTTHQGDQ